MKEKYTAGILAKFQPSFLSLSVTLLTFVLLVVAISTTNWIVVTAEVMACECRNSKGCDTEKTKSNLQCTYVGKGQQNYGLTSTCFNEFSYDNKTGTNKCFEYAELIDKSCQLFIPNTGATDESRQFIYRQYVTLMCITTSLIIATLSCLTSLMKTSLFKTPTNYFILFSTVAFNACAAVFIVAALIMSYANVNWIANALKLPPNEIVFLKSLNTRIGYSYGVSLIAFGMILLGIMINVLEYKILNKERQVTARMKLIKGPHSGQLAYQEDIAEDDSPETIV